MATTEIAVSEAREMVVAEQDSGAAFLTIIAAAARDPQVDVSKMEALLRMQETIAAKQAEVAFNQAMTRLQPKLPVIVKRGKIAIEKQNVTRIQSTFATYDDIDHAIRPLLCAEGFSLAFNAEPAEKAGLIVHGTLSHSMGHSRTASMPLPADTSGSKNPIQAVGSTLSYARRYLVGLLLNIVTKDEDDDGTAINFNPISTEQIQELESLIGEIGMPPESRNKFLATLDVKTVSDIQRGPHHATAIKLLEAKRRSA